MEKAVKKPKQQVRVIVAKGVSKGKGRYKIVDARMKKEVRGCG